MHVSFSITLHLMFDIESLTELRARWLDRLACQQATGSPISVYLATISDAVTCAFCHTQRFTQMPGI